ncbi:MAG: flagellar protein FlaG [Syntrophomonadaceae bacterium]|nr:flagellar protein FlaG [Syntrophomonadaceae bacterium]
MRIQDGTTYPAVNRPVEVNRSYNQRPLSGNFPTEPVQATQADNTEKEKRKPTLEQLNAAIELLNKALEGLPHRLSFIVHEEVNQMQVEIVDKENKIIKKIPPDEVMELVNRIQNMIGWFLDKKV